MAQRIFISMIILVCLVSCHKKEQQQEIPCANSISIDTAMAGFFFQPGSYWIYRNDSLNAYDSVVLKYLQRGCECFAYPPHSVGSCDYYIMNYSSYPSGAQYYDCIEEQTMMRNNHPGLYWSYGGWHLFISGQSDTCYIDSMQIAGHLFYLLYKSWVLSLTDTTAYTAKNIGVVKKIIPGPSKQEWDLIRWKIYK